MSVEVCLHTNLSNGQIFLNLFFNCFLNALLGFRPGNWHATILFILFFSTLICGMAVTHDVSSR